MHVHMHWGRGEQLGRVHDGLWFLGERWRDGEGGASVSCFVGVF